MSLTLKYSDPQGIEEPAVLVSLGSNVRFGTLGLAIYAEVGEPAVSTVDLDDPGGIYDFVGLRAFDVRETSAPSNNRMIGRFVVQNRTVTRSPERSAIVGADRVWTMDLTDYNWHLGKRILVDSDAKRPAETSGDRLRWLLHNAAHISLNDYGHVTYPSDALDAHDYRGETAGTVLSDCCVEGGYNFWADFNEAHGRPELFFIDPNNAADTYAASITISNVESDVDSLLTFAPYEDATLERSTERLAYGVYLAYANGFVYVNKPTTGDQFALIDRAAPMSTVHTAAKARRVATKFLNDNASESDRITCSIKVPAAQVNDVRHGQLIQVRFSHFPGYETPQIVRVVRKTVLQEDEGGKEFYKIGLEMVPLDPPAPVGGSGGGTTDYAGAVFAGLQRTYAPSGPTVPVYAASFRPGENFVGFYAHDDTGPIAGDQHTLPYSTITVTEPMTVRLMAQGQGANVFFPAQTRTLSITVNGVVVGTDSRAAGPGFDSWTRTVDVRDYHLSAGDVVGVTGTITDEWGNSAVNQTYLMVGRGTIIDAGTGNTIMVGP